MLHNNYQLNPPPRYDDVYFEAMETLDRIEKDKGFPQQTSGEGVTSTPTLPERVPLSSPSFGKINQWASLLPSTPNPLPSQAASSLPGGGIGW